MNVRLPISKPSVERCRVIRQLLTLPRRIVSLPAHGSCLMSFLDPFKSFFQSFTSQLQSDYYIYVFGALGVLLVAGTTYVFGWGPAVFASPWFWGVVALLLVVGIFFGIRYGVPRLRERYFLRKRGSEYVVAGQESPEEFQAKFLKALQTLKGLPQLKGKDDP